MNAVFIMKRVIAVLAAAAIIFAATSCEKQDPTVSEPQDEIISQIEKPKPSELRKNIVGSWGRLGEVMHEFYEDGDCIIGGMYGYYEVTDVGDLVMTTVNGTKTEYAWNDRTNGDYWTLDGDTLMVNGSQFTRIETETVDESIRN